MPILGAQPAALNVTHHNPVVGAVRVRCWSQRIHAGECTPGSDYCTLFCTLCARNRQMWSERDRPRSQCFLRESRSAELLKSVSGSVVLGSSPGTPAREKPPSERGFSCFYTQSRIGWLRLLHLILHLMKKTDRVLHPLINTVHVRSHREAGVIVAENLRHRSRVNTMTNEHRCCRMS